MEMKIFNSIVTGDLRTNIGDNKIEKYFEGKLRFKHPTSGLNNNSRAELKQFLLDHPLFKNGDEYEIRVNHEEGKIEFLNVGGEIFEPMVDLDLPPHFNATTEFYSLLIDNEYQKVNRQLHSMVQTAESEKGVRFILKKTFSKIEFILEMIGSDLKSLPLKGFPFYEPGDEVSDTERIQRNTHYVLYFLKTILVRLYFEIKSSNLDFIEGIGRSESELYNQVLRERSPIEVSQALSKKFFSKDSLEKSTPKVVTARIKNDHIDYGANQKVARKYLEFFSGFNIKGIKVMPDGDYKRMLGYVDYLIEHNSIPPIIDPIAQLNIDMQMIRYTFYLIHKELYTTRPKRAYWIEFLRAVFVQFSASKNVIGKKFANDCPYYSEDLEKMRTFKR